MLCDDFAWVIMNRKPLSLAARTARLRRILVPAKTVKRWSVREAKAKFSALVRSARNRPQCVTYRGREAVVVLSIAEYARLQHQGQRPRSNLTEFLANTGFSELDLKRRTDLSREIEL